MARGGTVVETGTHASLLAARGAYHALVAGQLSVDTAGSVAGSLCYVSGGGRLPETTFQNAADL